MLNIIEGSYCVLKLLIKNLFNMIPLTQYCVLKLLIKDLFNISSTRQKRSYLGNASQLILNQKLLFSGFKIN